MNRSPLHDLHDDLGARFTDFGGWEMPLQYESVLAEHRTVRESVGVFDVTHLGRFSLSGKGARRSIRSLFCNDIDRIEPGRCQYTMMLNEDGGVIDDIIVWWLREEDFIVMPNAANQARVMEAFRTMPDCNIEDLQKSTVFLAVQGPSAPDLLQSLFGSTPGRFRNASVAHLGGSFTFAGTGYTGERGAEILTDPAMGVQVMQQLVDSRVAPCGLGARDTLRLEAGFPLWGNDLDETTTPIEAGLDFAVSLDHDFVGRERLVDQVDNGVDKRMAGFVLEERGVPRSGYAVSSDGSTGTVTSGNMSPMLNKGIGLAYFAPPVDIGSEVEVDIRGKQVRGTTVKTPFHQS